MNIEWVKLFGTPFIYLSAIILAVYFIWRFRFQLACLINDLGIKSFKFAGVEIAMAAQAVKQAKVNRAKRYDIIITDLDGEEQGKLDIFAELVAPYVTGRMILWVDDEPLNNTMERRAFRLLGINIITCLGTSEAGEALHRDDYDLVISDVTRRNEDDGWKTLAKVRDLASERKSPLIPFIFYHGRIAEQEERDRKAINEGAIGAIVSPSILYQWVLSVFLYQAVITDDYLRHLIMLIPMEFRHRLTKSA